VRDGETLNGIPQQVDELCPADTVLTGDQGRIGTLDDQLVDQVPVIVLLLARSGLSGA
jgi:hypothetical protein